MQEKMISILIVEDDEAELYSLKQKIQVSHAKVKFLEASTRLKAQKIIQHEPIDLALIDINLNGIHEGLDLLVETVNLNILSIIISGENEDDIKEKAFELGAINYITKPVEREHIDMVILRSYYSQNTHFFEDLIEKNYPTNNIAFKNHLIELFANYQNINKLLILGETGVGKTKLASSLAKISDKQLVIVDCTQFSDPDKARVALFGALKGAYTGLNENKIGLLEKADNGILYLDEFHHLPKEIQKTLLKPLDEKIAKKMGGKEFSSNFHLIVGSNREYQELYDLILPDLLNRIHQYIFKVPPLIERPEDIKVLFRQFNASIHPIHLDLFFSTGVIEEIRKSRLPDNARGIRSFIEFMKGKGKQRVTVSDVKNYFSDKNIKTDITNHNLVDDIEKLMSEKGATKALSYLRELVILKKLQSGLGVNKIAKTFRIDKTTISKVRDKYEIKS